VSVLDLAGRSVLTEQHLPDPGEDRLDRLDAVIRTCVGELYAGGADVLGVTVAVPGLVDRDAGTVVTAPNLHWQDVPLAARVRRLLAGTVPVSLPVYIDNDANCAARAEVDRGAAQGLADVLYLTGTVGLGCGLVLDGQVYRGRSGFAGEVGHMPLGDPEARCACGRLGCWEASVGLHALLRAAGRTAPDPLRVADRLDPVGVATDLALAAESDPVVAAGVRAVADRLARGVATLVTTLNPQMVVLGGSFVPLGPWIEPTVREAIAARVLAESAGCAVALSELGLHAASDGAAAEVLAGVYAGRLALA
jgi:predicted NBD/HSP70 family sugar kinase